MFLAPYLRKLSCRFLICLLGMFISSVSAAPTLTVAYFEDVSGTMTVTDVLALPDNAFIYKPQTNVYSPYPIWFKVQWQPLTQTERNQDWQFVYDFTNVDYSTLYLLKHHHQDKTIVLTETSHQAQRLADNSYHKLTMPVGDADYLLLRTDNRSVTPIMFRLISANALSKEQRFDTAWYAAVYAIVLVMLMYNAFVFFYLRDRKYFYYCLYLASMLFTQCRLSGIGKQLLWTSVDSAMIFINVGSTVCVTISGLWFMRAFLPPQSLTVWQRQFITLLSVLSAMTFFVLFTQAIFSSAIRFSVISSQIVLLLAIITTYYTVIRATIKGDQSAVTLLITSTVLYVASLVSILRHNGLLTNTFFAEHILDIAVVFEAVVLSLALAQQIQSLRLSNLTAVQRQRQQQEQFSQQLLNTQEHEKRQLSSALHDNFTHQLLILKQNLTSELGKQHDATRRIEDILHEIRHLSHVIHPYVLEKLGLNAALDEMIDETAKSHALDIHFICDDIALDDAQSILVYRIVQECLNNIIKHADASECIISIKLTDYIVTMTIKDDGKGFDPSAVATSLGLTTIKERAQMLHGTLDIASDKNGTTTQLHFPIKKPSIHKQGATHD